MRRFFIDKSKCCDHVPVISGSDAKHIRNVLRLIPGDHVLLFDGTGTEYEAQIISMDHGRVGLRITNCFSSKTESPIQIVVAQGFLKDKKMDILIRALTELGITKWIPFIAERSIPKPDQKRLGPRMERWKKIARESLKQCKRTMIPEIGSMVSFEEALTIGGSCDLKILFWENERSNLGFHLPKRGPYHTIFVMLGPEGGFTNLEIESARGSGFVTAGLGPRILRAETAAIAGCTLVQYLLGDMGQSLSDEKRRFPDYNGF